MFEMLSSLKRFLPRPIFSLLLDALLGHFWRREDRLRSQSLKTPPQELRLSERGRLIEGILEHYPFTSLAEIGCGYGQNFVLLGRLIKSARLVGIDRNPQVLRDAARNVSALNLPSCEFFEGDPARAPLEFPDRSFDIVVSSAFLLYISAGQIETVAKEMLRLAKLRIILLEQHIENEFFDQQHLGIRVAHAGEVAGYWVRDYRKLFAQYVPASSIDVRKVPNPLWEGEQWAKHAHIIEIRCDESRP